MIWNDKLLFLHVPKTGGMSVTDFLLDNLASPVHYTTDTKHRRKKRARFHQGRRHETVVDAEAYLNGMRNTSIVDFETVVAVMRNPYDLEVSRYHYLQKGNAVDKGTAQDLAMAGDFTEYLRQAPFFGASPPRLDRYFTIMGMMPENLRIIRYEHLEQDFHRLVGPYLFNQNARLPHMNRSQRSDWREYYDEEAEALCYHRHAWFFDKGYYTRFDPSSASEDDAPAWFFPDIPGELLGPAALGPKSIQARGGREYRRLANALGADDLSDHRVLDVGCGAALGHEIVLGDQPVGAYLGLAQQGSLRELLRSVIADERIGYGSLEIGGGISAATLPDNSTVADEPFDTIWVSRLLRVLEPSDIAAVLTLCRERSGPDARLVAQMVLKARSASGGGIYDHMERLGISDEMHDDMDRTDPFGPLPLPEGPMLYSRERFEQLTEQCGWVVDSVSEPEPGFGHVLVCRRKD